MKAILYRLAGIQLGKNAQIVGGAKIHFHTVKIGRDTWVGNQVNIYSSLQGIVEIGSSVDIAPGVTIITGTHEIGTTHRRAGKNIGLPIQIGNGCWIGVNTCILGGSIIGKGCIVAAGAVVKGTFPNDVLIGGIPARVIKKIDN